MTSKIEKTLKIIVSDKDANVIKRACRKASHETLMDDLNKALKRSTKAAVHYGVENEEGQLILTFVHEKGYWEKVFDAFQEKEIPASGDEYPEVKREGKGIAKHGKVDHRRNGLSAMKGVTSMLIALLEGSDEVEETMPRQEGFFVSELAAIIHEYQGGTAEGIATTVRTQLNDLKTKKGHPIKSRKVEGTRFKAYRID